MRVVLGVTGGIAAYKAALLLRLFTEAGHEVTVVPTEAALRFVGAPTWEALSGRPVRSEVWASITEVPHVRIGQEADLVVVAPATADILAKAATGLAGDLLTNVLLTARCPVVMAPAMHTEMWQHPATVANVATLRARGVRIVEPASGRLTGTDTGPGRLPEPEEIYRSALAAVEPVDSEPDLSGLSVLITAAAPVSRWTPSVPGQPQQRQAGSGAGADRGGARSRGHPRRCAPGGPTPCGRRGRGGRDSA